MFGDGLGDGRHVDVAYRDGRGQQAVYLPADLTATVSNSTAGATVYLYLESAHLTAHSYDWGAIHGTYDGTVPRVFVSRDINDVNAIATRNAFLRGVLLTRAATRDGRNWVPARRKAVRALSKGA